MDYFYLYFYIKFKRNILFIIDALNYIFKPSLLVSPTQQWLWILCLRFEYSMQFKLMVIITSVWLTWHLAADKADLVQIKTEEWEVENKIFSRWFTFSVKVLPGVENCATKGADFWLFSSEVLNGHQSLAGDVADAKRRNPTRTICSTRCLLIAQDRSV